MSKSIYSYALSPAPRYFLRLSILSRLFRKYLLDPEISFMEIGAGKGDVSAYLIDQSNIQQGLVVEQSSKAAEIIRNRIRQTGIEVVCEDIRQLEVFGFDCVLSFEVLEHIDQDRDFMKSVNKRLKMAGLWFISVPAYMRKWQKQDEFSGHVRRYEEHELRDKLTDCGFTVLELLDYGFPLTSLMRPFRDIYYKDSDDTSMLEKTLASGTENRGIRLHPQLMRALLIPFTVLQGLFAHKRWGDGFIVVARKSSEV